MADRDLTSPVPRTDEVPASMFAAARQWESIALKWRDLAERRRDHHLDLCKTGRWRHYFSEGEASHELHAAVALADRWAAIAPREENAASVAEAELAQAA